MSIDDLSSATSPEPESEKGSGQIVIDGISYIPSSVLLTGIPKISFKDNSAFGVVDNLGEASRLYSSGGSELGIYFNDTRHLGVWEMTFNGIAPVPLAHELRFGGHTAVFSMTNRDFPELGPGQARIPRDTFLIRRILAFHNDTLFEAVEIKNFANESYALQIEQWAGGRFDDVFEVRGITRDKRGKMLPPEESGFDGGSLTVLRYEGLDSQVRSTYIRRLFDAEKIRLSPGLVGYFTRVEIPPKGAATLRTIVSFDRVAESSFHSIPYEELTIAAKMDLIARRSERSPFANFSIDTDDAIFNRAIQNAKTDIFMLLTEESVGQVYPYAGIPWFSAPFGRDGMITAYQMLPWYPDLARGVLDYGLGLLGIKHDDFTDEQPGKVFHEMRRGEMAKTREVPFIPYYGSVDSTPLALILLHEYVRWTMDVESLRRWWPQALKALEWVRKWGDTDSDGFLEYERLSNRGLVNQGWKDSSNCIMHADGSLAESPIRLCEVQGYAFRARMGMSALARLMGDHELASTLRMEALRLKAKFIESFWDVSEGYVYLALDRDGRPCAVRSSNMGHCLWSEILSPEQARTVAGQLMSDSMFSGYGIRTLADTEVAYNPLSYHNGSIWPHDNSIIMEGFRNYGLTAELDKLASGLIGVLESSEDFRLPELFCGFRRRGDAPPVPYEVACKPQAWAAGSIFLMIKAMLGLSMDADQSYVVFNSPILPRNIRTLEVRGLKGRDWEIDFVCKRSRHGTLLDITRRHGSVRVLMVK